MSSPTELIPAETIQRRLFIVRGKRVLVDADLARFYRVGTRELNRAVARNPDRFPDDFAFRLTPAESRALMFQSGTSKPGRGGTRKPARVFTEQGVAMLASVLRSPRAVAVSVAIVRAFVRLRDLLAGNRDLAAKMAELERRLATHDGAIRELFAAIREFLAPPARTPKREMGFHTRLLVPGPPQNQPGDHAKRGRVNLNATAAKTPASPQRQRRLPRQTLAAGTRTHGC